jgi:hypothetical protein
MAKVTLRQMLTAAIEGAKQYEIRRQKTVVRWPLIQDRDAVTVRLGCREDNRYYIVSESTMVNDVPFLRPNPDQCVRMSMFAGYMLESLPHNVTRIVAVGRVDFGGGIAAEDWLAAEFHMANAVQSLRASISASTPIALPLFVAGGGAALGVVAGPGESCVDQRLYAHCASSVCGRRGRHPGRRCWPRCSPRGVDFKGLRHTGHTQSPLEIGDCLLIVSDVPFPESPMEDALFGDCVLLIVYVFLSRIAIQWRSYQMCFFPRIAGQLRFVDCVRYLAL